MTRKFLVPIELPADPAAAMEAATKQYVDANAGGGGGVDVVEGDGPPSGEVTAVGNFYFDRTGVTIPEAPAVRVYRSAVQSVPNATVNALFCDSEAFDPYDMHPDPASGQHDKLFVPTGMGGLWLVGYDVQWSGASGTGVRQCFLGVNGSGGTTRWGKTSVVPHNGMDVNCVTAFPMRLAEGDSIQVAVYQNAGGALNIIGGPDSGDTSHMWMVRLGP